MVDIVGKSVRSKMMAANKAKNTKPEMFLRSFLHKLGFRYRIHVRSLPGSPDLVLAKYKLAIFVHGCFWHQHPRCRFASTPDDNRDKWNEKFSATRLRDERCIDELLSTGWRVFVIWECGLTKGEKNLSLAWLPDAIKNISSTFLTWPRPSIDLE